MVVLFDLFDNCVKNDDRHLPFGDSRKDLWVAHLD